jgi:hypothetical protein
VRARAPAGKPGTLTWALFVAAIAACGHTRETYVVVSGPRDWSAHPAIQELGSVPGELYAISDVHGGYDRMVALLTGNHLIAGAPATPGEVAWTGGNATLVVVGDMIDKGPKSLEVVEFFVALQKTATTSGGQVIVTLGNHEAEFLYDPANDKTDKSDGARTEMAQLGVDPIAIASGADPRGQWLRDLPFAARVGRWFFAHAGNTAGRSIADLESALQNAIDLHPDYDSPEIVGGDSILESKSWYDARAANASALGVDHIVIGHQPTAVGPAGKIAITTDGLLLRIDCGMSPSVGYSAGQLLHVRADAGKDVAESLDPSGVAEVVWRAQ